MKETGRITCWRCCHDFGVRVRKKQITKGSSVTLTSADWIVHDCPRIPLDTPCWIWRWGRANGYARVSVKQESVTVTRLILGITGMPRETHAATHACDNPPCVNPDHIRTGTTQDNAIERAERNIESFARGERVAGSILTAADIPAIRQCVANGESQLSVSRRYGVSKSLIHNIVHRKAWKHVP